MQRRRPRPQRTLKGPLGILDPVSVPVRVKQQRELEKEQSQRRRGGGSKGERRVEQKGEPQVQTHTHTHTHTHTQERAPDLFNLLPDDIVVLVGVDLEDLVGVEVAVGCAGPQQPLNLRCARERARLLRDLVRLQGRAAVSAGGSSERERGWREEARGEERRREG